MFIVSCFVEFVKEGIHIIIGKEPAQCPCCGKLMHLHCRCVRYVRRHEGQRDKLSLRVFYCSNCHRYHRELPNFIVPYRHLCTKILAAIYDDRDNYAVDNRTIIRIRRWVNKFMKFGVATIGRLQSEHPSLLTKYDVNSTYETLRYFVKLVVNACEWKFNELA